MQNEQIDIYPEFTGTVLESLVKVPDAMKETKLSETDTYQQAKELLHQQEAMTFLQPMAYQNTYALAVKESFAKANQLETISDLIKVNDQIKAGFTLEFIDRNDGYRGFNQFII